MRARLTKPRLRSGLVRLGLVYALFGSACGGGEKPAAVSAPAMTAPVYVGEIAVVDKEARFVLIDLNANASAPGPGTALTAISAKGESVRLKVTPERKRPFVTADIVSGTPTRGERVYR